MTEKVKNIVTVALCAALLFGFGVWSWIKPADAISDSERRPLAQLPTLTLSSVASGKFMSDFEKYATDQFPLRDDFRSLKALTTIYLLHRSDMGGIYVEDGYVSKLDPAMDTASLDYAAQRFEYLYETYFAPHGGKGYLCIIPDKNLFMGEAYPTIDYAAFAAYLQDKSEHLTPIDISGYLELSDFYKTDTHWRQENILDAAQALAEAMGVTLTAEYEMLTLDKPFYGVYHGQAALPLPAEELNYLTNDMLAHCTVYDYEMQTEMGIYDMEKAYGKDPYELFLSGSKSLLTIRNENATTDKKLVIFRDSFGSSIAPLLAEGYAEITLADIRYLPSERLGSFLDFSNCDALFLYSTMVLNNSITLK